MSKNFSLNVEKIEELAEDGIIKKPKMNEKIVKAKRYDIFLSYNWDHKKMARLLYNKLTKEFNYKVWIDDFELNGTNLFDQIVHGISNSVCVLCCITKKYSMSENCIREINFASANKKPLVIAMLENLNMSDDLGSVGFIITPLTRYNFFFDLEEFNGDFSKVLTCESFNAMIRSIEQNLSNANPIKSASQNNTLVLIENKNQYTVNLICPSTSPQQTTKEDDRSQKSSFTKIDRLKNFYLYSSRRKKCFFSGLIVLTVLILLGISIGLFFGLLKHQVLKSNDLNTQMIFRKTTEIYVTTMSTHDGNVTSKAELTSLPNLQVSTSMEETIITEKTITEMSTTSISTTKIINRNLINYWPLNGSFMDIISGCHFYDGVNVSFTSDRFNMKNQALSLNQGYLKLPRGVYFNGSDFTLMAWVYMKSYNKNSCLFDFGNGNIGTMALGKTQTDRVKFTLSTLQSGYPSYQLGSQFLQSSMIIRLNRWYHIAFSLQKPYTFIHINGVLTDHFSISLFPPNVKRSINFVGRSLDWSPFGDMDINADIDELKIYNRALTEQEIFDEVNN